jgi:hypothetical protein
MCASFSLIAFQLRLAENPAMSKSTPTAPEELKRKKPAAGCDQCGKAAGDTREQSEWTESDGTRYCPRCTEYFGIKALACLGSVGLVG